MIPMRYIFRSRWAALIWAGGICLSAVHFAKSDEAKVGVDAANSADGNGAQASALIAEIN
ncbi:MAG: hypothetical protein JF628_00815 [Sphingomonas sp.]|nr:hypothetical protein [Sphingomonas sp.]